MTRALDRALAVLDKITKDLNLSSQVREEAVQIYRRGLVRGLQRGRRTEDLVGACVYIASRRSDAPRKFSEIADTMLAKRDLVSRKTASARRRLLVNAIARCERLLIRELELSSPFPRATSEVSSIGRKLGLSHDIQEDAVKILEQARTTTLGKDPGGMAAAALYRSCVKKGVVLQQWKIAEAAKVTEVTLRSSLRELEATLEPADAEHH